ncbi:MAG: AAA family ATPase [Candidatus Aminicenantes bacterium]|nr:MAG: AAA family ATPase [Candidatus Aminicenantes bacterium]
MKKILILNLLIFCIFLSSRINASVEKPPLPILDVFPKIAPAGGEVEIRFYLFLSPKEAKEIYQSVLLKYKDKFSVFFNNLRADIVFSEIISREEGKLIVIVPPELLGRTRPKIVIESGPYRSEPFQNFSVASFEIVKIIPEQAEPGSNVIIEVSKRVDHVEYMEVTFDAVPAEIINVKSNLIRVKLPGDIKRRREPDIIVALENEHTEPFVGFYVETHLLDIIWHPVLTPGLVVLVIIATILIIRLRRRIILKKISSMAKLEDEEKKRSDLVSKPEEDSFFPPPKPPDDLIRDCVDEKCVLYIGAGLSAQAGFPTWQPFVQSLLNWAIKENIVEKEFGYSLQSALDNNETDLVADSIVSDVQQEKRTEQINDYLRNIFLHASEQLPKSYRLLKDIDCSAILSTNFDSLIEETFKGEDFAVYTPMDTQALLDALPNQERFILKLYGDLKNPDSVLVAPAQYEAAIAGNKPFSEFMQNLFYSRTILFLGSSLEGIEAYLEGIKFREHSSTPHYALVAVTGRAWKAKADLLLRRYGIEVLPYTLSNDHPEVLEFLKLLVQKIKEKKKAKKETQKLSVDKKILKHKFLKKVRVENIGPFDELELELDANWNILIGDNGVGKSTVLKAIAVGLCGEASSQYAERLIKTGRSHANIILKTNDDEEYVAEINKLNGKAEVKCFSGIPLSTERWLALGFPPMRTVTWERIKGPKPEEGKRRSTPDDLLPLIRGEYDPRMDELKQWIVNIDYRIKDDYSKGIKKSRADELFIEFFNIVDSLTEGITIKFKEIDSKTKRVNVITDDGIVPIEAVSQGTTSIIGWIGILLQRLYEIYENEDHPVEHFALVLIDEIDAHMHPAWQQSLIPKLEEIFPNVQFIATTHSPLIVGGMPSSQVFRFARDEWSKVIKPEIDPDMTMGRADQILTGQLFGLASTLDKKGTEEEIKKYQQLLAKKSRTPDEEKEFFRLHQNLEFRIPVSKETPVERRAHELLDALLKDAVGAQFPEIKEKLLKKAEQLFSEVKKKQEKIK